VSLQQGLRSKAYAAMVMFKAVSPPRNVFVIGTNDVV
jgi:hypothetical protein